jgi:putative membrane protein
LISSTVEAEVDGADRTRRREISTAEATQKHVRRRVGDDGCVSLTLPEPSFGEMFSRWSPQPVAVAAAVLAAGAYVWALWRQRPIPSPARGDQWATRRSLTFILGLALFVWVTCGLPQVYAGSLYEMWTAQHLSLLLIVPVVLVAGQPVDLARQIHGDRSLLVRFTDSTVARLFVNPLVGPVLVPALSVALFFGPLAGWAVAYPPLGDALAVLLVIAGALIVLPLVATGDRRGSTAVGLAVIVGMFELLLDAIPGIVLRLHPTLITSYFDHRAAQTWAPNPLHDQQLSGGLLWCVSELVDLPFLVLIYVRWLRADARDAAEIDSVLDAERIAHGLAATAGDEPAGDEPWWLTDPSMRERFRL